MNAPVDVVAALRTCRMETALVAAICKVPTPIARRALRAAESAGDVERVAIETRLYGRRGAAVPLVWRATDAALARCEGGSL